MCFGTFRRGIPSGISFAKEHVVGSTPEKSDQDGAQTTPLFQRQSYNQGISSSGSSGTPTSSRQPSLRRIIKPPARFKNARMSLRLRARPVLCGKCRSLCDGKEDSTKDDNEETEKAKKEKDRIKSTKTDETTGTSTTELTGKLKGAVQSQTVVDPKDLCYESVGSTRVVENFWKRPLMKPLIPSTEETYAKLRKHKLTSETKEGRKRIKPCNNPNDSVISNIPSSTTHHGEQQSAQGTGTCSEQTVASSPAFLTKSTACDTTFPNTRSRKASNLKMCITKITERRNGLSSPHGKRKTSTSAEDTPSSEPAHSDTSPRHSEKEEDERSTFTQPEIVTNGKRTRSSSKKSKQWDSRIRSKSTVPERYRDDSTKNIFSFNKRRPVADGSGEIPVLTLCRSEDPNQFKVSMLCEPNDATVTTSKSEDNDHESEVTPGSTVLSSSVESSSSSQETDYLTGNSSSNSPCNSTILHEVTPNFSIKSRSTAEVTKTPSIKITFGSSGNGMVVQIPPKTTQQAECTSTTELKANRKAMKKAKKEAKRKRSLSPSFLLSSPSTNALSPDPPIKAEPSTPASPESQLASDQEGKVDVKLHLEVYEAPSIHNSDELIPSAKVPKKRKKQKKRRRSIKTLKENDDLNSCSSHDANASFNSISTSQSNENPTNDQDSPPSSASSLKSFNLDNMSNSDSHESHQNCRKESGPQRVCINLKRINTNAYVPLPQQHDTAKSNLDHEDLVAPESNGIDLEGSDSNEFPDSETSKGNEAEALGSRGESMDFYRDKDRHCTYEKGDIIWGKLPAWPWWPGKVSFCLADSLILKRRQS